MRPSHAICGLLACIALTVSAWGQTGIPSGLNPGIPQGRGGGGGGGSAFCINIVGIGDSLTVGYSTAGGATNPWLGVLAANYNITGFNQAIYGIGFVTAVGGLTIPQRQVGAVNPLLSSATIGNSNATKIILWAGTNDVWSSSSSASSVAGDINTYVASLKSAGFSAPNQIYVLTMLPRQSNSGNEITRLSLNSLIISNAAGNGYTVVDVGSNANIGVAGSQTNATYFQADQVHLTLAGETIVANMIASAVNPPAHTGSCPASPSYVGPGDIVAGPGVTNTVFAAYGLRAFSSPERGNPAVYACNSTGGVDVACGDILTHAVNGSLLPTVIGGIICPNPDCTAKIIYDRSGALQCSNAQCDVSQSTVANRATLVASCVNGKPCLTCAGSCVYTSSAITLQNVPYAFSGVATWNNSSTTAAMISNFVSPCDGSAGGSYITSAFSSTNNGGTDSIGVYAGSSSIWQAALRNKWHTWLTGNNSGTGTVTVDGTTGSTGAIGSAAFTSEVQLGKDCFANTFTGSFTEIQAYTAVPSAAASINTNQTAYWGPF